MTEKRGQKRWMEDVKIVMVSRKRAARAKKTLELFPDAVICVDEEEVPDYEPLGVKIVPHPKLPSLPAIRNWVLDNFDDEILVMTDDDITVVQCNLGSSRYIRDPMDVRQLLDNSAQIAKGIGAPMFGYAMMGNTTFTAGGVPIKLDMTDPLNFNHWTGGVLGFIGRKLRYDENVSHHDDLDISLQCIKDYRILFRDQRFQFKGGLYTMSGGSAGGRTGESERRELEYLKRKWGPYIKVTMKNTIRVKVSIARKQSLQLA